MGITMVLPGILNAQVYTMPTSGLQNANVGICMVNTCSGTVYDDGGAGGNYSPNVWGIYRTFCPNAPGQCVRLTFSQWDYNDWSGFWCGGCCDFFEVIDGATQNNTPAFGPSCGSGAIGPFTSSDSSGCLGIRVWQDNVVNRPGFTATISCVPCTYGQSGTNNNDCTNFTPLCGNMGFSGTSNGPGLSSTCGSCVLSENYSAWYQFSIATAGTLNLNLTPTVGTDDYDFAIYAAANCGAINPANPLRCSYAANTGTTGLNGVAGDNVEDVLGDGWVQTLNVNTTLNYYLMINDWSGTNTGFNITWGGTAVLNCNVVLPVELLYFTGRAYDKYIELDWETASERNVHHYVIDKYIDDEWVPYLEKPAAGGQAFYAITDINPLIGENIYRLRSVDYDGHEETYDAVSVNYWPEMFDVSLYQSDNFLTLHTQQPIEDLKLFNAIGQELKIPLTFDQLDHATYRINISSLPENTYLLRVNNSSNHLFIKYSTR